MAEFKPTLTEDEFNFLHKELNASRQSSAFIKVPREGFMHLLYDHSALLDFLGEDGVPQDEEDEDDD